jgi:osmotically-inducible protein OsmY
MNGSKGKGPGAALAAAIAALCLLQGCAPPLMVAGAAAGTAGTVAAGDRRTTAAFVDDQLIESRARGALDSDRRLIDDVHVTVTSYNQVVLLTGQVPSEDIHQRVVDHVRAVQDIRAIHDHIEVGPPSMLPQRSRDTLITTRVKSDLLGSEGAPSIRVKVVTENGVVYLMGLVKRGDVERIAGIVQRVEGVRQVVLVFEYTD